MQKVTKKMLAMVLATAMLLGCLAGCRTNDPAKETTKAPNDAASTQSGTTGETEKETETEPSLFNVGTLPIVNEPVTLKILTIDGADGKASDAGVWAWLEEQTGIHFEVESYSKIWRVNCL